MFTASTMISRAMTYYIPRGHHHKRTKIFVRGRKKKTHFYYGDRKSYRDEYLNSEHWNELRERKLKETPLCETCGSKFRVEPHHINYRNLYDVQLSDLKTLCRSCHTKIHSDMRAAKILLAKKMETRSKKIQLRRWRRRMDKCVRSSVGRAVPF